MEGTNEKIMEALITIGKSFGLTEEDFENGRVTKENLFNSDEVIIFD